jgi:hypothetical protein
MTRVFWYKTLYILLDQQQLSGAYDITFSVATVHYSFTTFQDLPNGKSISYFTDDFKRYESIISKCVRILKERPLKSIHSSVCTYIATF